MWTLACSSKEHCANVHPHKALRLAVKSQAQSQGHTRVPGKSARTKCCPTIKCMRALSHYETLFYNVFMATFCIFCWLTESGHEWGWGGLPEKAFNFYKTMIIQIMALMKAYSKMLFPGIFNYCNYVHSCSLSLFLFVHISKCPQGKTMSLSAVPFWFFTISRLCSLSYSNTYQVAPTKSVRVQGLRI